MHNYDGSMAGGRRGGPRNYGDPSYTADKYGVPEGKLTFKKPVGATGHGQMASQGELHIQFRDNPE